MGKVWSIAGWSLAGLGWVVWRQASLTRSRPLRVIHEAGHALLGWQSPYVGRVVRVTVVPGLLGPDGVTETIRLVGPTSAFANAVIAMGGIAGEMVGSGRAVTAGSDGDFRNAEHFLREAVHPAQIPAAIDHAISVARQQIVDSVADFRRLCVALDRHDTLTTRQLEAVLGPRPPTVFSRACRVSPRPGAPAFRGRSSAPRPP